MANRRNDEKPTMRHMDLHLFAPKPTSSKETTKDAPRSPEKTVKTDGDKSEKKS